MKDVFLMERVYGACWLPHMHNSFSPSLPLRRLLRPLLPRKPPATLSCCSSSPDFRKVTAGCFASCGLWPVWLSLNTPLPLRIAQQALCQTQARQSQGCRLASLLSTSLAAPPPPLYDPMPRGHCFTGLGGGTFNPGGQSLPRRPTSPLFGGHAPTRLDRQSAGGEVVRLDGMKHPIIPPSRCQQAAVPQRKAAHFEQYRHFIPPRPPSRPPPPQSVLERRGVVALQRSSHSTAFVSADKAAQ